MARVLVVANRTLGGDALLRSALSDAPPQRPEPTSQTHTITFE